ncbi:MAG: hypothetical protein ABI881_01150 [Betaproteobacteria bacterium]
MQFQNHEIPTLPSLAWCARVDRGSDVVAVFHGRLVEMRSNGFFEGTWNDSFASFNFTSATIVAGTGAIAEPDRIVFSGSTDHLGPLFSISKRGSVYVSNSPAFVLTMSEEEPDDIYPFYAYDFVRIFRRGLFCPNGHLRLRSATKLGLHYMTMITIDRTGRMAFEPHRLCEAPHDYRSYERLLLEGTKAVVANGTDPARKQTYAPLVPLSRGYDSTAAAVLAKSAGCTEAFTYEDNRRRDAKRDSGASNARFFLKMNCSVYSRWQYLALDHAVESEFGYAAVSSKSPLAAVEAQLHGRILVLGEFGDTIWDPEAAKGSNRMSKSWARRTLGLSAIEFRLRVGFLGFAPAYIAARHNVAIQAISTSEEMRPWSIGGEYDRPLPRRIAEEGGVPRDRFATHKAASSHSGLIEPGRFSAKGLDEYRQFLSQRHAGVASLVVDYWKARVRWRHYVWDLMQRNGHDQERHVRSTIPQRHFPFLLNASPTRVPWDYMFTMQWSVASMRGRYTLPEAQTRRDQGAPRR